MKRRTFTALAAAACLAPAFAQTSGDAYPSRPLTLVVPFQAGGPTDAVARALADALRVRVGQPVLVENKPGAGGAIANEYVARAAPDGYTMLLAGSSLTMNAAFVKAPYDPVTSFSPVSLVLTLEIFLVVRPDLPVTNVQELVAYAKARPGKLSYSSVGNGSVTHLQMELFKSLTGTHMVHIPYRGAAPALTDFLAGQIDLVFDSLATSGPHIRSGRARALAVASPVRSRALPQVPTLPEAGVAGYDAEAWSGILLPARTPAAVVERLNRDVVAATKDPAFQQRVEAIGGRVVSSTPAEYDAKLRSETAKWARLVQERGLNKGV
ncbi:MAG: tripartite tricarboxylate transporter substrate binding protein [Pseudomonadota bacterium]